MWISLFLPVAAEFRKQNERKAPLPEQFLRAHRNSGGLLLVPRLLGYLVCSPVRGGKRKEKKKRLKISQAVCSSFSPVGIEITTALCFLSFKDVKRKPQQPGALLRKCQAAVSGTFSAIADYGMVLQSFCLHS